MGSLQDGGIDAVLICTPTDMHADLIETACRAGKAVFCEKPVDLDAQRIRACLKVVRATRRPADDRLQPALRSELRARCAGALRDGEIGEVEIVSVISRDPAPPPAGLRRSGRAGCSAT